MESQSLIDLLIGVVIMLLSGVIKVLWDAVKSLQQDINKLEVALPTVYMAKHEFRDEMREIKMMLKDISAKLDGKVDK